MNKDTKYLCRGIIRLPYDIRSLNVLRAFITKSLAILNVPQSSINNFLLAAEEISAYILYNHISPADDELITVEYTLSENSILEFEFHYMGTPIRKDEVGTYKQSDASDTNLDKLWYHLVKGVADSVELINLGNDGWHIIFSKKVKEACYTKRLPQTNAEELSGSIDISKAVYRQTQPADAASLVELTHKTYAYTFAEPEFYYSEHLEEAIKNGSIASVVAELDGRIIGHTGLAYHKEYPESADLGMLMVSPEYRQTRLTFKLTKCFLETIYNKQEYRRNIITSVCTTAHKASQHMIIKLAGAFPIMIMISACPRADYETDRSEVCQKREALVFGVKLNYQSETTIFIPEIHQSVMVPLFEQLNANITMADTTENSYALKTKTAIERFDLSFSANLILESRAEDWLQELRIKIYALRSQGIRTINILIPAWQPLPPELREKMKELNAFFAGTAIFRKDKWYLAYITLDAEIINFNEIEIYNPAAKELLNHIADQYNYVLGGINQGNSE